MPLSPAATVPSPAGEEAKVQRSASSLQSGAADSEAARPHVDLDQGPPVRKFSLNSVKVPFIMRSNPFFTDWKMGSITGKIIQYRNSN